ncbi:hypothetical protein SPF06_14975 [Sinomonas sp. JGH33]|uniref:Pilus assembly protein TadE n=1 Tax=Sinomonas terricola TaxID=3110330 RepID=A0ABU5T8Q2_9MICC|nr:hypothetical protein [Sinomonas sp. JGH33]MEA5456037.1 hypothetical protein [Sinomonas sp. JGH33]
MPLHSELREPDGWPSRSRPGPDRESGGAAVEFVMLGALLMVPIVYFILGVGILQGASFAAAGAADHAAKVFVRAENPVSGQAAAEAALRMAVADFGLVEASASLEISCDRPMCLESGTAVSVTVVVEAPLPLVPALGDAQLAAGRVSSSATQIVGRFR